MIYSILYNVVTMIVLAYCMCFTWSFTEKQLVYFMFFYCGFLFLHWDLV